MLCLFIVKYKVSENETRQNRVQHIGLKRDWC